ncbi:MAG TPA: DNA mismatch repair protein MutS, partial [Clostridiales bacterium]|nr:DNA mismatch repair protein MutS [Clostridiales bacterium]
EQMEDPKLCKGLVSRDIVRIISPGTIMETSMLREGESNYLGAVMLRGKAGGCAFADVSTGEVCAASFETDAAMHIQNEISRFRPRECVLAPEAMLSRDIRDTLEKRL